MTVSPRLFISVIGNVSNVAKLTKSNSFDQKMNLATLSVSGRPVRVAGKQTKKTLGKKRMKESRDVQTTRQREGRRREGGKEARRGKWKPGIVLPSDRESGGPATVNSRHEFKLIQPKGGDGINNGKGRSRQLVQFDFIPSSALMVANIVLLCHFTAANSLCHKESKAMK